MISKTKLFGGPSLTSSEEAISFWFGLSYAHFLTIPRLILESMPPEWQKKMVTLLNELDETFDWLPEKGKYWVQLRDDKGRFVRLDDDMCDYRHGNIEHLRRG